MYVCDKTRFYVNSFIVGRRDVYVWYCVLQGCQLSCPAMSNCCSLNYELSCVIEICVSLSMAV